MNSSKKKNDFNFKEKNCIYGQKCYSLFLIDSIENSDNKIGIIIHLVCDNNHKEEISIKDYINIFQN